MHYTGKNLYITFGGTVVSGDQRTLSKNGSVDTVDTTAGADTDKSYALTLRDATFDITILDNGGDGSAVRAALHEGNSGTLIYAPEGTAAGKPKYECYAHVTSFNTAFPYDGEVEFQVSLQKSGTWTYNYEISGSTF